MTQEFVTLPREVVEQAQMWIPLLAEIAGLDPETTAAEFSEFADGRPASEFTIAGVITALRAALEQPQGEQEPVGYEYVEHRPYGAPGEIRRGTILLEHYRNADGAIAGDWEWLVQQFKTSKNTISMRPLYTQPQPNPGVREAWIHGWEAAKLTNDIK